MSRPGIPAIDPNDPFRFVCNGKQLYVAGFYPGLQPLTVGHSATRVWYRKLIDQMKSTNVNLLRVVLTFGMALGNNEWLHPYERSDHGKTFTPPPESKAARNWRSGYLFDLSKPDEAFFHHWAEIVNYAGTRDVIVQACIFDGVHTKASCVVNGHSTSDCVPNDDAPEWDPLQIYGINFDYYNGFNNINGVNASSTNAWYTDSTVMAYQKDFVRRAVLQLRHFDNLIWELINEPPNTSTAADWGSAMLAVLNKYDPDHLVMGQDLPNHQQVAGQTVPTPEHNGVSDFVNVHQCLLRNRGVAVPGSVCKRPDGSDLQTYEQPLISDNDYSVDPGPLDTLALMQRRKAWTSVVSGGYASMLVYNVAGGQPVLGLDNPAWRDGMKYVGLTKTCIESLDIDLSGMEPLVDDIQATANMPPVWGLARTKSDPHAVLIYFFEGGSVNLQQLPESYTAKWFDPRTGDISPAEPEGTIFSVPSTEDWVLYVEAS